MQFFIPHATGEQQAEEVYESIKKFAASNQFGAASDRRIFRIKYRHDGKDYQAEVGKMHGRIGEVVIAILESYTYLICTPNRGVIRGDPCMVGHNEISEIIDFDELPQTEV